jgi:hypothetical protein
MHNFIRKQLPMMFAFFAGVVILVAFFSGKSVITSFRSNMQVWVSIIGGFTLLLGVVSITSVNFHKVKIRGKDWPYKLILLICLAVSGGFGIFQGTESGTVYDWLFQNMVTPMMSSMFAMLAFFIASAAYRAFRARTVEATILLIVAIIVMLGRIPLGQLLFSQLPGVTEWIMNYPNLAVQRGIIIGAALGAASMSIRIILGIERTYMGKG